MPVTSERLKELLEYDPETGEFSWKADIGKGRIGSVAGTPSKRGYIQIGIDRALYYAHRLAWLYVTGEWPNREIDHVNGDRASNAFTNLRQANRSENKQNQRNPLSNNRSGFLGVYPSNGKFCAQIGFKGKRRYLGTFDDPSAAYEAYLSAKRDLHPFSTL